MAYIEDDDFTRITCDNFDDYKDIDIVAFSIADLGACGSPGSKVIVDSKGNIYDMRIYDSHPTEEQFLSMFPLFRDYHPVPVARGRYKNPGWTELCMGLGNHLMIRDDYIERFDKASNGALLGDLYMSCLDTILSIIKQQNNLK